MEPRFFTSFATPCVHHDEAGQVWGGASTSLQVAKMALCAAALTVDLCTLQLFAGGACRLTAHVTLPKAIELYDRLIRALLAF